MPVAVIAKQAINVGRMMVVKWFENKLYDINIKEEVKRIETNSTLRMCFCILNKYKVKTR